MVNPTSPMPSYADLREKQPEQFDQMVQFMASLRKDAPKEDTTPEPAEQAASPRSTAQAPE